MRRWLISALTIWVLAASSLVLAQTPNPTPSPHIYLIKAGGCTQQPSERSQTGFRVKDQTLTGIVTALHGVVGCKTITAASDDDASKPFLELTIAKVDIARDVALLWSKQFESLLVDGLVPEVESSEKLYEGLQVIGYHSGITRQAPPEPVSLREVAQLIDLVPDSLLRALQKRQSPELGIRVLNISGNLLPGHSGAPILNGNRRLVGIGNGGIDLGRVGWGWAIPWHDIDWKTVSEEAAGEISQEDKKKLADLVNNNPQLVFSFSPSPSATPVSRTATAPPKVTIKVVRAGSAREIKLVSPLD
jgi:hypothetical protein